MTVSQIVDAGQCVAACSRPALLSLPRPEGITP